jgi:hypothetical protein
VKDMVWAMALSRHWRRLRPQSWRPNYCSVEERATLRYQGDEIMELGIFSFGDVQRDPNSGALGSTADAVGNLREAIALADAVGLDYFGVGEHHTYEMPASADERTDRWVLRGLKVLAFL